MAPTSANTSAEFLLNRRSCGAQLFYLACSALLLTSCILPPEPAAPPTQDLISGRSLYSWHQSPAKHAKARKGNGFARIVDVKFKKLSGSQGEWSGVVEGNGEVHLELRIYRGEKLETSRYMGHVTLLNKQTTFKFNSSLPKGRAWDWKVVAVAT